MGGPLRPADQSNPLAPPDPWSAAGGLPPAVACEVRGLPVHHLPIDRPWSDASWPADPRVPHRRPARRQGAVATWTDQRRRDGARPRTRRLGGNPGPSDRPRRALEGAVQGRCSSRLGDVSAGGCQCSWAGLVCGEGSMGQAGGREPEGVRGAGNDAGCGCVRGRGRSTAAAGMAAGALSSTPPGVHSSSTRRSRSPAAWTRRAASRSCARWCRRPAWLCRREPALVHFVWSRDSRLRQQDLFAQEPNPARRNIWRLSILIRLTCPSTTPEFQCSVRPAVTASRSRSRCWARLRRLGSSVVEVAASIQAGNWSPWR
jgi:hypothetical protein